MNYRTSNKRLKRAYAIIESLIKEMSGDSAPIDVQQLKDYAEEAAGELVERINNDPDWQPNEDTLGDELFVATADNLENYYKISVSSKGTYDKWFSDMWDKPAIKEVIS